MNRAAKRIYDTKAYSMIQYFKGVLYPGILYHVSYVPWIRFWAGILYIKKTEKKFIFFLYFSRPHAAQY